MVYVRNVRSLPSEACKFISYTIIASAPATGATLTASVPSPQVAGTIITLTAGGSGGSQSYEYKFLYKTATATTYTVGQGYSTSNTFALNTAGLAPDTYTMVVYVRNVGSFLPSEACKFISYTIVASAPATGATLTASVPSPQVAGTIITLNAGGSGGSQSYEYKFLYKTATATTYTVGQEYSTSNTFAWNTAGLAPDTYTIVVYVRNAGSFLPSEAYKFLSYAIVASAPATGATLTASVPSPQVAGTIITLTAGGTGGSQSYEYKFLYKTATATTYTVGQDYSALNTFAWNTSGLAPDTYTMVVYVRNVGSPLASEACRFLSYNIAAQ